MFSEAEIKKHRLDEFHVFLAHVWAYLQLPPPTPVQIDIAKWLQHGPRRAMLQAFRGVGKSWITVAFVVWCLFRNPQMKIEVISASKDLADDFTKFAMQLIYGMPLLHHLAPQGEQRQSAMKFDVGPAMESKDPSLKSVGITGQITGTRADLIIADDIEVPKNSQTVTMREKLAERVKEFDAILKPQGRVLYLGTPQVEDTLYTKLLARGYDMRIYPAEIPERPDNYNGRLAPYVTKRVEAGWAPRTPLDPDRFGREDLLERLTSYGAIGYALQFMLDVSPSEADKHPLKLSDLMVTDIDPEVCPARLVWGSDAGARINELPSGGFDGDHYHRPVWTSEEYTPYQGTVMAIDPSGKGKDETAYSIVKYGHGLLYLVKVAGFIDGYSPDTLEQIALAAKEHGVNDIVIEENYGGGMFNKLLEPWLYKVGKGRIDYEYDGWSRGMKEERIIDTLLPVVRSHRLVVDRRLIEEDRPIQEHNNRTHYSWVRQFTRMQKMKGALPHEDRLESTAMAVGYWTERMNRDNERAHSDHKRKALMDELKKHVKHAFTAGRKKRPSIGLI